MFGGADTARTWDTTKEAGRVDLTTRLRNNHSFADGLIGLDGVADLQNPAHQTYFADGVHLTAARNEVVANAIKDDNK